MEKGEAVGKSAGKMPAVRRAKTTADPSGRVPSTSWTLPQARLTVDLGGPVSPAPLEIRRKAKARGFAPDDSVKTKRKAKAAGKMPAVRRAETNLFGGTGLARLSAGRGMRVDAGVGTG
jgi:hypothetical protein